METRSKRKLNQFKRITPRTPKFCSNIIRDQSTLVGSFLKLMENQKSVIAVVRLSQKNKGNESQKDKMVPICFKVEKEQIPEELKERQIHCKNLITIQVPDCNPIQAMIVSVGDDSIQLFENYGLFINEAKKKDIKNLETKINDWLSMEGIKISKFQSKGLPVTSDLDFEKIIKKTDEISNNQQKTKTKSSPSVVTVDISCDDCSSESKTERKDSDSAKLSSINSHLKKIKDLISDQMDPKKIKQAFDEILKVLESIVHLKEYKELVKPNLSTNIGFDIQGIRYIPEKDLTHEAGTLTFIEGILPIATSHYKQAMGAGHGRGIQPSTILTNIIRFSFPKHWLVGVTLKGTGGNTGLAAIWNYSDPLKYPCQGAYEDGLGERRIRALFDHVIRKSKRTSYDRSHEQTLVTNMSKAMNNKRNKIAPSTSHRRDQSPMDENSNTSEGDEDIRLASMISLQPFIKQEKISDDEEESAASEKIQKESSNDFNFSDFGSDNQDGETSSDEKDKSTSVSAFDAMRNSPTVKSKLSTSIERLPDNADANENDSTKPTEDDTIPPTDEENIVMNQQAVNDDEQITNAENESIQQELDLSISRSAKDSSDIDNASNFGTDFPSSQYRISTPKLYRDEEYSNQISADSGVVSEESIAGPSGNYSSTRKRSLDSDEKKIVKKLRSSRISDDETDSSNLSTTNESSVSTVVDDSQKSVQPQTALNNDQIEAVKALLASNPAFLANLIASHMPK